MTKQKARMLLMREARLFYHSNVSSEEFENILSSEPWRLTSFEVEDAYYLIANELEHIIHWVWHPINFEI